jgi:hypothetical protein
VAHEEHKQFNNMKKILFVFVAAFAVESIYSIANAIAVRTTCGRTVTTVGPEFFLDDDGNIDDEVLDMYMLALNKTFCDVEGEPTVIHN